MRLSSPDRLPSKMARPKRGTPRTWRASFQGGRLGKVFRNEPDGFCGVWSRKVLGHGYVGDQVLGRRKAQSEFGKRPAAFVALEESDHSGLDNGMQFSRNRLGVKHSISKLAVGLLRNAEVLFYRNECRCTHRFFLPETCTPDLRERASALPAARSSRVRADRPARRKSCRR